MKAVFVLCLMGVADVLCTEGLPALWREHQPPRCSVTGYEHWHKIGKKCFKYFGKIESSLQAELECRGLVKDGHLASIHSSRENTEIFHLIMHENSSSARTWIGGFRFPGEEKTFLWTDGSTWDYANWVPGEPNKWGGKEDCTELNWSGHTKWNDHVCTEQKPYICQFHIQQLEKEGASSTL